MKIATTGAAVMSSDKSDWETPQAFFDNLNKRFKFTLDAAASRGNAKCENYYTIEDNALARPWVGSVWLNPPYGRAITPVWVKKAYMESIERHAEVCVLLPARTDTKYFHKYIMQGATEIWFVKGRLKFVGAQHAAPFPSMLVFFDTSLGMVFPPHIYSCDKFGNLL